MSVTLSDSAAPASLQSSTTLLVEVLRSGEIESVHRGCIAVTNAKGDVLAEAGYGETPVFWRSAAKLHQAVPLVMSGGVETWRLSGQQLAVICGSHNGEPEQVRCVESILERIGVKAEALKCGPQEPYGKDAAQALIRFGESPNVLHNTCSGNHAGLLALDRLLKAEIEDYDALTNSAQQRALAAVARFSGVPESEIFVGIDGCGIPAYRTPLSALATAFARLVCVPDDWEAAIKDAAGAIVAAVSEHPDFISGRGELDTEFIRAFGGTAICKLGAEAVCAAAFAPTPEFPEGVGIALKVEDGMGNRARSVALASVIEQLHLGTEEQRAALEPFIERTVKTRRDHIVGEIRPAFPLKHRDH